MCIRDSLSRVSVPNSGFVSDVFMASIWCLINSDNYVDAVLKAVNLGGDADTIGAVTGGLAGIIYGHDGDNGIPVCWSHALSRIDYIEAVSYTHLDVYKRQVQRPQGPHHLHVHAPRSLRRREDARG